MKVFVAGANGVIGRPLLDRLQDAGHDVVALARSEEKAAALSARGVEPVTADALDHDALRAAVLSAQPEIVINQLTALPWRIDPRKYEQALGPTNRLRREAGPVLASAAVQAGARRIIAQSVCFMLEPEGPWVLAEEAPLYRDPPKMLREAVDSMMTLEQATLETPGIEGIVLRYGFFYGPGSSYAPDGSMGTDIRKRRMPVLGSGEGRFSFVHVDDAADATVCALDRGAAGIYNIADDEPALQREWVREIARVSHGPKPFHLPLWVGRLAAGPMALGSVSLRGASNAKARRDLGWTPAHPDWRAGFAEVFGA